MAYGMLLACAALSWIGCFALVSSSRRQSAGTVMERHARRFARHLAGVHASLATSAFVRRLLRVSSWCEVSDWVCERAARRGHVLSLPKACAALVMACAGFLLLCWVVASPVGVVVGVAAIAVGMPVAAAAAERSRTRRMADEIPDVFRTLAMAISSGETLSQAIEYVGVHEGGLVGRTFAETSLRIRCGESSQEALGYLERQVDAPGIGLLVTALAVSQRTGSPLRGLFETSATLVERQTELERSLAVKTAQVRLSVRIVCLLPVILVTLLSLISTDFQKGLCTPGGIGSVVVAAMMDSMALVIIRHLMRGVV